jgi:hypothetical protein
MPPGSFRQTTVGVDGAVVIKVAGEIGGRCHTKADVQVFASDER